MDKSVTHIDNEQTHQFEQNFKIPRGIIVLWLLMLGVLIAGLYLACGR